ncbi:hypothetical protein JOF53_003984 [Crossiella equi]|uniref:ESX secretion-associated protein EspG n=1 Tax=Crossiella equi TaxID=130796 RepID=A0ABS5AFS1_9PSEU|nr:ESX secretion-associated protein EspG [Crossiella equi]MBP2475112.1 hypothetical protein [Crossiella equi]
MSHYVVQWVQLSTVEFLLLWDAEGLGERHLVLDVPGLGIDPEEGARRRAGAWGALRDRGLARRERAADEVAGLLGVLARPRRSVDGRIWLPGRHIRCLAAARGEIGALAVWQGESVWLSHIRGSAVAEAAVATAGELSAGPGRSVAVPRGVLHQAHAEAPGDDQAFIGTLVRGGVRRDDARVLADMLRTVAVHGQFGVEVERRRADRVVAFHGGPAGCYSQHTEREWTTVAPAGNRLLVGYLERLLSELD